MNKKTIALAVVATLGITGCSMFRTSEDVTTGKPIAAGPQQAISEQRLANDFKRQGVRVVYSLLGNLEALEATGYAPVWGSSENAAREAYRAAELEAKKSMNDFINKEQIRSTTSINMISNNLERAKDNKLNNIATNRGRDSVSALTDEGDSGETNTSENKASRTDALNIATKLNTNITVNASGILGGMYLVEGEVINGGKNVRVVYRWDLKHQSVRNQVRQLMAQ